MAYYLGIDLGTTFSAAAVSRADGRSPQAVTLGERSSAVPTAVFGDGAGGFLFGVAAERRALAEPDRVARGFKRRIGDGVPVVVSGVPVPAEELTARFVRRIVDDVLAREGERARGIAVTHPASWGGHRLDVFRSALRAQGLGAAMLLPEPQAAAIGYAAAERVEPGAVVAIYDLGGGTFDAAVVRKRDNGEFEQLGTPEGIDDLGGMDFDEAVLEHVRTAVGEAWDRLDSSDPEVLAGVARLRRDCAEAKEALSVDTEVQVPVALPGLSTRVHLSRAEFEERIRAAVSDTVAALGRALDSAGVAPNAADTVLLVGGSSRIPLVSQQVSAFCRRPVSVDADPKGVIAAGAAIAAEAADTGTRLTRLPAPPSGVPSDSSGLIPLAAPGAPAANGATPNEAASTATGPWPVSRGPAAGAPSPSGPTSGQDQPPPRPPHEPTPPSSPSDDGKGRSPLRRTLVMVGVVLAVLAAGGYAAVRGLSSVDAESASLVTTPAPSAPSVAAPPPWPAPAVPPRSEAAATPQRTTARDRGDAAPRSATSTTTTLRPYEQGGQDGRSGREGGQDEDRAGRTTENDRGYGGSDESGDANRSWEDRYGR